MAADELIEDEGQDDEADPGEPADVADETPKAKPKPKAAPKGDRANRPGASTRAADAGDDEGEGSGGADDKVTVDLKAYNRKIERLNALEAAEREKAKKERERNRKDTEALAVKDWPKAKERLEAQHRADIEERDKKLSAYENRLRTQTLSESIRAGFDAWNDKNPERKIRSNMAKHLQASLEKRIAVDWDDEAGADGKGDFVAYDVKTNRMAADMIQEWLSLDEFAGFLEASNQGGAGARVGGARPGTGGRPAEKGDGAAKNPFAEIYNRKVAERGKAQFGIRPSIGLSSVGHKATDN